MSILQRLALANQTRGHLCLGLDPDPAKLPKGLSGLVGVEQFCLETLAACADEIVAVKPNLAFFEQFGAGGWQVLERLRAAKPDHLLWILDAKRGDIGNTAKAYATALYDGLGADFVTVNPYLGFDSVQPFLENENRGIFLLALTSNPGSNDFQHHGSPPLWKHVIATANQWDNGNIGFVVGATRVGELAEARTLCEHRPLLIPGIGAQGGSLEAAVADGLQHGAASGVINISRAILYSSTESDFASAAHRAAVEWKQKITTLYRAHAS